MFHTNFVQVAFPLLLLIACQHVSGFIIPQTGYHSKVMSPLFAKSSSEVPTRRQFVASLATTLAILSTASSPAQARFVLDEETGDYVEVEDVDWQTAWKQRLDKASTMSNDEIFQAARGAGNLQLKEGMEESDASKKRRAMSACRDASVRAKASAGSEKECAARVFQGEVDFMLNAL